jgi:hypothetical protein
MMTRRLWRALGNPPYTHPIFQRMSALYHYDEWSWPGLAQTILIHGQIWLWAAIFVLDTRLLILMVFSGTVYGVIWSAVIGETLAAERQQGMYELLCMSPTGPLGVTWTLCTACLHRGGAFAHVNSQEAWSVRLILFIPLLISANMVLGRMLAGGSGVTFLGLVAFGVFFYFDHIQSIVLGSLFGMLAPHRAVNRVDARVWGMGGFLGVQLVTYLVFVLTAFAVLPVLYSGLAARGSMADIALAAISLGVCYLVREAMIAWLWRVLTNELNAAPADLDFIWARNPF